MPNHSIWDDTTNPPAWRAATAADVGSGTSTVITIDGEIAKLPKTISVPDATPIVVNTSLLQPVTSVKLLPDGDAELTLEYRFGPTDDWEVDVVVTAVSPLVLRERYLDAPAYEIRITRTDGTSTASTVEISK